MPKLTRRSFVAGSATAAGLLGLAACGKSGKTSTEDEVAAAAAQGDEYAVPSADAYPIDPDGDDVEALYEREEMRNGWIRFTNPNGVEIGVADEAKMIQVNGLVFKDSNGSGKLDLYEDWRQTDEDRAAALASELTAEEASNKSIVMLKNAGGVIAEGGIQGKPKAYVPQVLVQNSSYFSSEPAHFEYSIDETLANEIFDVVTDDVPAEVPQDEAHEMAALHHARPGARSQRRGAVSVHRQRPQDG